MSFGRATQAVVLTALLSAGCTNEVVPQRDCFARVWVHPDQGNVQVVGAWDGWAQPGITPEPHEGGWKLARFELPPGEYGYLVDNGAELVRDPHNALTTFDLDNQMREVSLMLVDDCAAPRIDVNDVSSADGTVTIDAQFLANRDASPLASVSATTRTGRNLDVVLMDPENGAIVVSDTLEEPRSTITLVAEDEDGNVVSQRLAAWDTERDPRDEVLYQVMIDRFRGDGGAPLDAPRHAGARAGGTLDGVRSALDDIAATGATALWLSPVYENPDGEFPGNDGQMYEGYHGYWPVDTRRVEPRFGGEEAFDGLIEEAHAARMLVLADVVPNHVFETHPRFTEGPTEWFNPTGCVCGTESCPWHEHIQDCWFTPYLPDMRLEHPDVLRASVDDVSWMLERFELDGLRVDAVPMMPRAATRRLGHRLRREMAHTGPMLLGEIFTGPGLGGLLQLKRHLGPAGMNSVFDFPLMWAIHDAVATGAGGFDAVEAILEAEEIELEGSGAILARILDNHDTPRFISVANGDGHGDPWDAPAEQPSEAEPYARLQVAFALIFTLPGIPVVFQGDEIGLAGANDPDCRRVMPTEQELNAHQIAVRETVRALGRVRGDSVALRRGTRELIEASRDRYVFARNHEDETVIVALSTADAPQTVETPYVGAYRDAISGDDVDPRSFDIPAMAFRILVPAR